MHRQDTPVKAGVLFMLITEKSLTTKGTNYMNGSLCDLCVLRGVKGFPVYFPPMS